MLIHNSCNAVNGEANPTRIEQSTTMTEDRFTAVSYTHLEQQYKIIGVLERKGDGMQGVNPDDTIFIPFSTGERFLGDDYTIPQIVAMADNIGHVQAAMKQMQGTLDYILEDGSAYMLEDAGSRIDAAMESARTMNVLLISVATIVFIVGGIGIMNVLFVSVKELSLIHI